MTEPPPALQDALAELVRAELLLVALDFDGTLAPEVDDPEAARALPAARAAVLRLLDLPRTPVALISGRALASLVTVSELPETVLLIGSHGVEARLGDPDAVVGLDDDERERAGRLHTVLVEVAAGADGAWVEAKPAGFALHTRLTRADEAHRAQSEALRRTEQALPGLTVRRGKNVLEFSVRSATKGEAVDRLRRHTGADAVFFAGDDVTDEDGFRALHPRDLGLKSGPGATAADFRVGGPDEVAAVLGRLADLRESALR